jgi:hypothetical protein
MERFTLGALRASFPANKPCRGNRVAEYNARPMAPLTDPSTRLSRDSDPKRERLEYAGYNYILRDQIGSGKQFADWYDSPVDLATNGERMYLRQTPDEIQADTPFLDRFRV